MSILQNGKILKKFHFFARAYPLIINIALLISFLITTNFENLYILGFLLTGEGINYVLKYYLFKPIMKNEKFPIIGLGKRPHGAKKCGMFDIKRKDEGYGMPSGHSQYATMFSSYLFLKTNEDIMDQKIKYIIQSMLILLALIIMYSRIHLNCHTTQQVLIGGTIGMFLGKYFYDIKNNYLF
jgi:membrane-associated phospholipid phosphatase